MLDLARLRALHAVQLHGSVGGAADALGYTPSAISQQITKLERETRTPLLERQGRGVVLTDAAELLVSTTGRLLSIIEEAEVALESQRGVPSGRLAIAAFATAARGLLPGAMGALSAAHPDLDLRLAEVDPHLSVDLVASGIVDLAVCHDWDTSPLPSPDNVSRAALGEDLCDMVLPAGHSLAARPVLLREDLATVRWIMQPPGTVCHDWLVRTLRAAGHEPRIAYEIFEYETQIALVAAGLGVALVPRLGRGTLPPEVVVRPLEPAVTRRLFAVWRTGTSRRPAITEAIRILRDQRAP
jgi:DNA-binding transcriptional LysR family regulator